MKLLFVPLLTLSPLVQAREFVLHTSPRGFPIVADVPGRSLRIAFPDEIPSVFDFNDGNVTYQGINLYLRKQSKYDSVFDVVLGTVPEFLLYIFYDTWVVKQRFLRAGVWGTAEPKQWFTCGDRVW